jgi:hypothetical protein
MAMAVAGAIGISSEAQADRMIRPVPHPPGEWVWVEPVYRTVYERVWVPDRIERVPERYWVSPTYGWRTVICYDEYGRRIETREWGVITPGHYETTYREVVVAGHYETRERRILVTAGYWKRIHPIIIDPPIIIRPDPPVVIRPTPPNVGVDGYASEWEKDKGKFSPLYEWPK